MLVDQLRRQVEGITLSQEGETQTHSGKVCNVQHISDFTQHCRIIKYDLQLECMLVCCGPHYLQVVVVVVVLIWEKVVVDSASLSHHHHHH